MSLERKQGLTRKTRLRASKPMSRTPAAPRRGGTAKLAAAPPRRKPRERTPEEVRCREAVAARSEGLCEGCGHPTGLEKAHRVARSQGGAWQASNILDLCHTCHHVDGHANPTAAYANGRHLRRGSDPTTEPVLLWKRGHLAPAYLDDHGGWRWASDEGPSRTTTGLGDH